MQRVNREIWEGNGRDKELERRKERKKEAKGSWAERKTGRRKGQKDRSKRNKRKKEREKEKIKTKTKKKQKPRKKQKKTRNGKQLRYEGRKYEQEKLSIKRIKETTLNEGKIRRQYSKGEVLVV